MKALEQLKTVLEVLLLLVFLILLWHVWKATGRESALAILTNKP